MAAADGLQANSAIVTRLKSFADMVLESPQPIPEVVVPFRSHKTIDGEVCVVFSKDELDRLAIPFQFSLVLKFLRQRPSLDSIRSFIKARWGLTNQPIVSSMRKPRNVFVRLSLKDDFVKAFARESCEINGVPYRVFHWSTDFHEDQEPVRVPVWITLPGLPPNFYHESFLRNITAPIGRFLKRDNPTRCATRTDGARVCVEMDVTKEPIKALWIGTPRIPQSFYQIIEFETLPAYCLRFHVQGHNDKTCKWQGKKQSVTLKENYEKEKTNLTWVIKEKKDEQPIVIVQKGESSKMGEKLVQEIGTQSNELHLENSEREGHTKQVADGEVDDTAVETNEALDVKQSNPENSTTDATAVNEMVSHMEGLHDAPIIEGSRQIVIHEELETGINLHMGDTNTDVTLVEEALTLNQELPNIDGISAQDGRDPAYVDTEQDHDVSDGHVYSDTDLEEVTEHIAKKKLAASDSDIQSEKERHRKGIKLRGSYRVVSKPSRLNL
ncbi:uncharacterized protein LOC122305010 [Carya illinoinensis]|uniref:uncharacterized protein LOC122305010 n=1 Tax=Carya illinoinensis TaxID=32201 RepID=UPI001C724F15|nr:uncharacterized protein LOC122305010 [Carya illinoinensis]